MDTTRRIRDYITKSFYITDSITLAEDDSLLDRGIIDSTGVLELIGFLEREFGIHVADDEMLPENLDSVRRIAAYVARKVGSGAPVQGR